MARRRAFLSLVGGAALTGPFALSRVSQSTTDTDTFSRMWGDPGGNAYADGSGTPRSDIELSWRRTFEARPTPIVGQKERLYLLFDSGKILSLDTSGKSYEMSLVNRMPGAINDAMLHGTSLFVNDDQNTMAAFKTQGGNRVWQRTHTDPIGEPVYVAGTLYYPTEAPSVLKIDPSSGSVLSEIDIPSRVREENPTNQPQLVTDAHERQTAPYIYGSVPGGSGGLFAYNTDTQSVEWAKHIEYNQRRSIESGGSLFTTSDSTIYRLDPRTGQVGWQQNRDMQSGKVAVVTSNTVVVWSNEKLIAVAPADGAAVWESGLEAPFSRTVIGSNDTVYVLSESNPAEVIGLDLKTGLERWRYPFCNSGRSQSPALTDEFLLVGHEQTLYAFSNESDPEQRTPSESETPNTTEATSTATPT